MGEPAATPRPYRVLLVDDNVDHARLALRALRDEAGIETDAVRSAEEGLRACTERTYHLVLLDYRLPDLSGLEVLRRLHARHPRLPVVLMTSQGSEEIAAEALAEGAAGYIVKDRGLGKRIAFEVHERAHAPQEP